MDALALLTADHNRVRGLFARFQEAEKADDTALLAQLGQTIITELEVHATIEEEIFYPEVSAANDEIRETVTEGIEEHGVVKTLAEEIASLQPGDEVWVAKCKVMIENVEHHAEEEESELFPAVRKALSTDALVDLAERMEARKAALGAPTAEDKQHLSSEDLHRLASEQQIPGRSSMNRDELVATVAPE
ncbi:MAG TPA: hemerythrin domain-containing protein [Acidimicrobiales bacterium]|nr:hemerythrin domain-containing protein [Acidimicrobiales bacterium]